MQLTVLTLQVVHDAKHHLASFGKALKTDFSDESDGVWHQKAQIAGFPFYSRGGEIEDQLGRTSGDDRFGILFSGDCLGVLFFFCNSFTKSDVKGILAAEKSLCVAIKLSAVRLWGKTARYTLGVFWLRFSLRLNMLKVLLNSCGASDLIYCFCTWAHGCRMTEV